jgi:UDPglucose 6-dehydrogenase
MKISVIGAKGVVGSAVANYFNSFGHDVVRQDIKKGAGITTELKNALIGMDFVFVCVPTPPKYNGACDLSIVERLCIDIGRIVSFENIPLHIIFKSTTPPGSTARLETILKKYCRRLEIAYNPEFLRQKHALEDMMKPSRIVVGSPNKEFANKVMDLYSSTESYKDVFDSYEAAELVKYYANAYYATRISFFNQMKFFADEFNCDHNRIVRAIVADKSVGLHGSNPTGQPYGGACLPKDVNAIISCGRMSGIDVKLLDDVERINDIMTKKISNDTMTKWVK